MEIISAKNPTYSNADKSSVDLLVTFETIGEVPFTAHRDDVEEHGRAIYADALAGKFGNIAPYVVVFVADAVRTECSRRIFVAASQNAQINMNGYMVSSLATDSDKAAFIGWHQWRKSMTDQCASLVAASDTSFAFDSHWPVCPSDVIAFVAKF